MNHQYRTVWNENTQSWAAASELAKGHSKSSLTSSAKKGILAAAVLAAISVPFAPPAVAAFTAEVNGTVSGETIDSSSTQNVNSGGVAISSTLQNSSVQNVFAGGSASATIVGNFGSQYVNGGIVDGTQIARFGFQYINSGGVANDTFVESNTDSANYGQNINDGGIANRTVIGYGGRQQISSGGKAYDTIINSNSNEGNQYVKNGGEAHRTVLNGGYQKVSSGGKAFDATLNAGAQHVKDGGVVTRTELKGESVQYVSSGGSASLTTVSTSGYGGAFVEGGGQVSNTTLAADTAKMIVYANGKATDTTVNGGELRISSNGQLAGTTTINGNGKIIGWSSGSPVSTGYTINNTGTLTFNQLANQSFGANMTGAGSLVKNGTNTLTLTGTNTYTGGTTVNSGILQGNISLFSLLTVNNAATYRFESNDNYAFSGGVAGAGNVVKAGTGTMTLSGDSSAFSGIFTVSSGILKGSASALSDNVVNNAKVIFDESLLGTYAGDMSGTGSVEKTGNGLSELTGTNSYTGGTTISAGGLRGDTNSLQGNIHMVDDETLLTFDQSTVGTGTFAGQITGAGALATYGTGTLTLGANAQFSSIGHGGGTLNIAAGKTATITATATLGSGDLTLNAGTTLGVTPGTTAVIADKVVFNNGGNAGTNSTVNVLGSGVTSGTTYTLIHTENGITGNFITLFNGATTAPNLDVYQSASVGLDNGNKDLIARIGLVWESTVADSAHGTFKVDSSATIAEALANNTNITAHTFGWDGTTLEKTGTGTLILTGANTYTGGTTVTAGTLQGNTTSLQGDIANNANLIFNQSGNGSYAGVLSGAGSMTKQGAGTLTLTGANTNTGTTTVAAGTLQGDTNSLKGNITNNANLVFAQSGNGSYAGVLSGTGSMTKQGSGTLTLTGTNTNTGTTTVAAGTLQGDTNSLKGNITNHANLIFDQSASGSYAGPLSGTGVVNKTGTGTLTFGNNIAARDLNVNGGSLYIAAGKRATIANDVTMANGTTLGLDITSNPALRARAVNFVGNNTIDITGLSGATSYKLVETSDRITGTFDVKVGGVAVGSAVTLDTYVLGSASVTNGGNDIEAELGLVWNNASTTSAHGTFNIASGSFNVGAILADNTNTTARAFGWNGTTLEKTGAGTLILTGANIYTGGTTVTAGTLQGNTTSLQGNIANNANLIFDQSGNGSYAGVLSGAGSMTKQGSGTLTLTGANTNTGTTTVAAGTLQGDTNSLKGNIANNATLVFDQSGNGSYAGVLSGAGSMTKQGSGTLTLTGANTNTGTTTVAAGTLQGDTNSLKGNITNNANLVFDQSAGGSYAGVLSGAGSMTKQGAGTLTLTGTNTNTGTTTVAAGTLQGNTDSLKGNITNNANLVFDQAVDGTYAGVLSGTGAVDKDGSAVLTFGENANFSDLNVNAGGVKIAAGKTVTATNTIDFATGTTLGLDVSSSPAISADTLNFAGSNTIDITGVGSAMGAPVTLLHADTAINGSFNVTVGGISLASTIDIDTYFAGTVTKTNGSKDLVGQFGLVWNDTSGGNAHGTFNITGSNAFNVSTALDDKSGAGLGFGWDGTTLDKLGSGTLILDAANTYTGLTTVHDGKLVVGSSAGSVAKIVGDVDVQSGATLGGHGSIFGTATIGNGATVAPGTSVGTLTVGQIVFQTGSTYEFEALTGTADKIVVSSTLGSGNGSATIDAGANLKILGGAGSWVADQTYTILEADGGVTGVFDNVTKDTAFLNHNVTYNANSIDLLLKRNTINFGQVGNTHNQRSTGYGIESLGSTNVLYQQIVGMNAFQAINAFDNLSGEIHASAKSGILSNSRYSRNAVSQHLGGVNAITGTQIESGKGLWINMWGHNGNLKADSNAAEMDNKGFGMMLGVDAYSSDKTTLGVALGYEQNELSVDSNRQSSADTEAVHLMAYGRTSAGVIDIKSGIGYSWVNADTTRYVSVGSLASKNEASYDAGLFQIFVEGSHTFKLNEMTSLTPYANLAYQSLKTDSFVENGVAAQLMGDSHTDSVTVSTLGGRAVWALNKNSKVYADIGWQHNLGGKTPEAKLNFLGGTRYTLKGVEMNSNSAVVGAGADFQIKPNMSLSVGYEGQFGNQSRDHAGKVRWNMKF